MDARSELVAKYEGVLLARVRRRLGVGIRDFTESTDCLQDVFVEIFRGLEGRSFPTEREFLAWATRILENRIRDAARRRRHRAMEALASTVIGKQLGAPSVDGPRTHAAGAEDVERLLKALDRLPDDYRLVIQLRDLDELAYPDVAEQLGRTLEATRRLHARAMARLSSLLVRPGESSG